MAESQLLIHTIKDAVVVNFRHGSILDSLIIDAIARELYALVDARAARKIVLDFGGVKFLASQAVGVLITLKRKAEAIGGEVLICNMQDEIRRVFKIMKLHDVFAFHASETDALESLGIHTD
ncbi:MAG: STAS domain-containing protein [Planctomycetes bacterium]|nr:STAS domain-containing protein [Planctomycetota bacterium]